ncbi:MAG: hypothetical protein AB2693_26225, partial [Candidatus Thiodiazotropha sp.]
VRKETSLRKKIGGSRAERVQKIKPQTVGPPGKRDMKLTSAKADAKTVSPSKKSDIFKNWISF